MLQLSETTYLHGRSPMAIIPQEVLFRWEEIEDLRDLERLRLVLAYMPDERLMRHLEADRGRGRDDYPIRAVWNSLLAGVVFQHPTVESLRRELERNAALRQACGFDPLKGQAAVPPPSAYTHFLGMLMAHAAEIDAIFDDLVELLRAALPDFGRVLAVDGKALRTHARPRKKDAPVPPADGRRDTDADFGRKTQRGVHEDGTAWEKVTKWFGYKLHLVVDAVYEMPVAYEMTKASANEAPLAPKLLDRLKERHPEVLEACEAWTGDKGYDDGKMIRRLWDEHAIRPVIDIKEMWNEPDPTRVLPGHRRIVYDQHGVVYCHCPKTGERRRMAYGGFEADRGTQKFRCPALHYGVECAGVESCEVRQAIRVPLAVDRRLFTPLARASYAWKRTYKHRTGVERVNSRLDVSFGFERHFIRGQKKMRLRMGLALVVMLAMAYGRIKEKQADKMRSLVGAA
jgi:hypothetical protein